MIITKEQEETVINCGAFGYDAAKMASILQIEETEIASAMDDEYSQFSALLKKGRDMADYMIDEKLFQLAITGDIKALEKLEARKRAREEEKIIKNKKRRHEGR